MRTPLVALLGLLLGSAVACSPTLTGAPCTTTDNCPDGQVCRARRCVLGAGSGTSGSSGTGGCPAAGADQDTSCPTLGAARCASHGAELLDCEAVLGCQLWRPSHDCGADGLECQAGASACSCPVVPAGSALFFVDGRPTDAGLAPTGAASPQACAFKTIDAAMQEVQRRNAQAATVVLEGAPLPPAWRPLTRYFSGQRVTPQVLDGYSYVATTAVGGDVSGLLQPRFGANQVHDGAILWDRDLPAQREVFDHEPATTTFPPGTTLTSAACFLPDAGTPCDPRAYVYTTTGPIPLGGALVTLAPGNRVQGVLFSNLGNLPSGMMLKCSAGDGGSDLALSNVELVGAELLSPNQLDRGLALGGSCSATLTDFFAGGFGQEGVDVEFRSPQTTLTVSQGTFGSAFFSNDTGLKVRRGTAVVSRSRFASNVRYGIRQEMHGRDTATVSLSDVQLVANHVAGLLVEGNATNAADAGASGIVIQLDGVEAARNNPGHAGQGGGLVFTGTSTLAQADNLRLHDNGGGQVAFFNATPDTATFDLSHPGSTNFNAAYCYSAADGGGTGVVYESTIATSTQKVVDAREMFWDSLPPLLGRDYDDSIVGQVDANAAEGIADAGPAGCTGP